MEAVENGLDAAADGLETLAEAVEEAAEVKRMPPMQRMVWKLRFAFVITFKVSVVFLVAGAIVGLTACSRGIIWGPMVAVGVLLTISLILGCGGLKHDREGLYDCYRAGVLVAVVALLGYLILAYVAVGGIDLTAVKEREYSLDDYGGWLRARVADPRYWGTTSACIRDRNTCFVVREDDSSIFLLRRQLSSYQGLQENERPVMSPIQSGCCKPPSSCAAFTYANGTATTPAASAMVTNADCSKWSNDEETLCFQCDSCKAGFLDDTKKAWNGFAKIPIIGLMLLIVACYWNIKYPLWT
ncbi:tetraspanin-3-like [Oryza brachyantha]|uniref:tetraspanin-3-like n=1 Tax=Oryza brachyantha TaxID=4533 RepID=UPI0003EAC234|nr:tetraspanin-3-like [Oryza brachyantha]